MSQDDRFANRIATVTLVVLLLCIVTGCGLPGHGEWILGLLALGILGAIALLIFMLVMYFDSRYERKR